MVDFVASLQRFVEFWIGTIISPTATFSTLQSESLWYGFGSVVAYATLYLVATVFLVRNRLQPAFPPYLPIAEEVYYKWQLLFTLPVALLGWLILGGTAYLLAVWVFGASGTLGTYLLLLGFAFYIPQAVIVWPPEMVIASLYPELWGADVNIPLLLDEVLLFPVYIWVGLLWSLSLTVVAVRVAGGTSWPSSTLVALLAISATMAFYVFFIR
ncbi:YIP1 family protein [Natrialbaceae archaeon A-CW3]